MNDKLKEILKRIMSDARYIQSYTSGDKDLEVYFIDIYEQINDALAELEKEGL